MQSIVRAWFAYPQQAGEVERQPCDFIWIPIAFRFLTMT
jgi:hypothetical protein